MARVHDTIESVAQQYFHKFRRHIYITPKSYLSFINSFKQIYKQKHQEISNQIVKLSQVSSHTYATATYLKQLIGFGEAAQGRRGRASYEGSLGDKRSTIGASAKIEL